VKAYFTVPTVTKLSDSAHLRIGVKKVAKSLARFGYRDYHTLIFHPWVARLVQNLPSFKLVPASGDPIDTQPLDASQAAQVRYGAKYRNVSRFLHGMKLVAVQVYQEQLHTRKLLVGEDYRDVGLNFAWKGLVEKRGRAGGDGDGVEWRVRLFREKTEDMSSGNAWEWDTSKDE